jgi:hypothetical protein
VVVRFVVLETGFKVSSKSESESDSDARRFVGLFRSASGRDGIAVDGCVVWIDRVLESDTECESSSESESKTESFAASVSDGLFRSLCGGDGNVGSIGLVVRVRELEAECEASSESGTESDS